MIPRSPSTRPPMNAVPSERQQRPGVAGDGVERQRDQHGPLALDEVVTGRLAGLRVAEDAELVVAELERLTEREPERRSSASAPTCTPSSSEAPTCSGRSMEYFADL